MVRSFQAGLFHNIVRTFHESLSHDKKKGTTYVYASLFKPLAKKSALHIEFYKKTVERSDTVKFRK